MVGGGRHTEDLLFVVHTLCVSVSLLPLLTLILAVSLCLFLSLC